ncbi:MAG: hypothetical protein II559_01015 [Muribaculaceae bacterium]|nr:hypothetical protein [Muribaculaceae bacterium]
MKKFLFFVATTLLLVACGNSGKDYVFYQGVTGSSGANCHTFEYNVNPDTLSINGVAEGDSSLVTLKLSFGIRDDGQEVKPFEKPWGVHIHGRDTADDVEFELDANEADMDPLMKLKSGETAEVTFTGKVLTADLEKLNGQKAWTSVIMR